MIHECRIGDNLKNSAKSRYRMMVSNTLKEMQKTIMFSELLSQVKYVQSIRVLVTNNRHHLLVVVTSMVGLLIKTKVSYSSCDKRKDPSRWNNQELIQENPSSYFVLGST